jgi:hypothetical protein
MTQTVETSAPARAPENETPYRALSTLAIIAVVGGGLSVLTFFSLMFIPIPLAGLVFGILAMRSIRSNPDELTGLGLSRAGIGLSCLFLAGGLATVAIGYYTEVPPGYLRISYADLQLEGDPPGGAVVPDSARVLDGKKVFIKGYMYPGSQQTGIKEFVLCRDNGVCCFGGAQPKLHDMVQVTMVAPRRVDHTLALKSVAGVFRVLDHGQVEGMGRVIYYLEADYDR